MKKYIIIAMMVLTIGGLCHHASAEKRVDWGLKLAFDCELPGKWKGDNWDVKMFKPGIGVNIGGVANLELGQKFFFEPGLSLFYSGYKYDDLTILTPDGTVGESDPKVIKYGLQIPLLIGYEIDFSDRFGLNIYTGPEMRYSFAGYIDIKNKILKEDLADLLNLWDIQKRFDLSWKIGIGLPLKNNSVLAIEADLGITDLLKEDMSFRENRIGMSFTKFF